MVLAPRGAAWTAKEGAGDCEPEAGREPEREPAREARLDHAGARGAAKTSAEFRLKGSGVGQSREDPRPTEKPRPADAGPRPSERPRSADTDPRPSERRNAAEPGPPACRADAAKR